MPLPLRPLAALALLACLLLPACRTTDKADADTQGQDPFTGEPKVTADVHYATAQVFESKLETPGPGGTLPSQAEATQLRTAALSQYAAALRLQPNHTPSLHRSAVLLTDMERYDPAIAMWERYVTATGRTASSLVNLGIANERAGRTAAAEKAYREATQVDPTHKTAHVNLGVLLAREGQLQPAQAALSAVLPPAAVHWHLAVALESVGRTAEADQQYRAAAALDAAYSGRPNLRSGQSLSLSE